MTRRAFCFAFLACAAALLPSAPRALNPIIQTIYSTDPAPVVFGDRVYVYTGHDEDGATNFVMKNWWVFSSADMVNWTAHGSPLSLASFPFGARDAWAGQCVARQVDVGGGQLATRYFWYVPMRNSSGQTDIGVAVSESPTGPFVNATGNQPLLSNAAIDPTVFIDGDGPDAQAYMYYGNPNFYYVKLDKSMTAVVGSPVAVPVGKSSGFGDGTKSLFTEGPWFYKRGDLYYMIFSTPIPEFIGYSTSSSPVDGWTYRGKIMENDATSFTSHVGVVDFKGKSYIFYHNGKLPGGGGFQRSVAVESFTYGTDGTIPLIPQTDKGVDPVATLDPYARVEAETIAWEDGVELETTADDGGGLNVTAISNGDDIRVMNLDFGAGAGSFEARVASDSAGGKIELRLGSKTGTLVGTCVVPRTGGWQAWTTVSCKVDGAAGVVDSLYLVFTGGSGDLFNVNWWRFHAAAGADSTAPSTPTGLTAGAPKPASVPLSWTGSTDDTGVIGYVIYRGTDTTTALGATEGTSLEVKGLTPSTSYDFTVRAIDAAGNVSAASSTVTVTTLADTTAPTAPGTLTASKLSQTGMTLTWTASTDDVGVTGYVISAAAGSAAPVQVGTTTDATTLAVTGLTPGTAYTLSVVATDAAGHKSTAATTTATTKGTAPTPPSDGGGGGGCGQGTSAGLALPAIALCLLALRRRRAMRDAVAVR